MRLPAILVCRKRAVNPRENQKDIISGQLLRRWSRGADMERVLAIQQSGKSCNHKSANRQRQSAVYDKIDEECVVL